MSNICNWMEEKNKSEVYLKCEQLYTNGCNGNLEKREKLFPEWKKTGLYDLFYKSLDLIQDTEDAIVFFKELSAEEFEKHSTIFIYGLMQAFICQQDGLKTLCRSVEPNNDQHKKSIYLFFRNFYSLKDSNNCNHIALIRWHRNNISGHPTDKDFEENSIDSIFWKDKSKGDKLYYFLDKNPHKSKNKICYAGYNPHFQSFFFNPIEMIDHQCTFAINVLNKMLTIVK